MSHPNLNFLSFPNDASDVTPNDGADLPKKGLLYIGVSGNLRVTTLGGSTITFANVPVGFFPVRVARVWATGTTATSIEVCHDKYAD